VRGGPFILYKIIIPLILFSTVAMPSLSAEEKNTTETGVDTGKALAEQEQRRRETLQFGTDAEIVALLDTLSKEDVSYLDDPLIEVLNKTTGTKIRMALFNYAAQKNLSGAEGLAIELVDGADSEDPGLVETAIAYIKVRKEARAVKTLISAAEDTDLRISRAAISALGACGDEGQVSFLIDLFDKVDDDQQKSTIIAALGEIGSKKGSALLEKIVDSTDENVGFKVRALKALSAIANPSSVDTVLKAALVDDANVRQSAVEALGSFNGKKVDSAIVEALRDSYYKTRVAAAIAAGKRKLKDAVPYLEYRARYDDVAQVREESLKSLALIGGNDPVSIVAELSQDKKSPDRIRIAAAKAYIDLDKRAAVPVIVESITAAKEAKQNILYNGLMKLLLPVTDARLEDLASKLLASKELVDNVYGLDITKTNKFKSQRGVVETLEASKNLTLARKARETLAELGN